MHISNEVSEQNKNDTVAFLTEYINNGDSGLSYKSKKRIENYLNHKEVFFAWEHKKIIGFIILEKIHDRFFEAKSLYILPQYRNQKVAYKLVEHATQDPHKKYIASVNGETSKHIAKKCGFVEAKRSHLPLHVLLAYLGQLDVKAVVTHLFVKNKEFLWKI